MADEKQLNAIRFFCEQPYSDHGLKRRMGKGRDYHDWSDLIQQISYFDYGHIQKDEALVRSVAGPLRKQFPSGPEWSKMVNVAGTHERILAAIRSGLAAMLPENPRSA